MQIVRTTLFGIAMVVLAFGAVGAEELTGLPAQPTFDNMDPSLWAPIVKSGAVNPLIMETGDMAYSGGSVAIPFSLNQRARVWLAVYDASDGAKATTGARGPFGAWLRLQPGPALFLASTAGADFEAGNNVITWDGNDWEGNSAGAGPFEFDLVGLNILEDLSVAGIAPITGFADPWIDLRTNEVWMGEYDRDAPDWGGHRSGDLGRSVLGTDFIANPNAWERWDANSVTDFEGARTLGGMRGDPDPDKQDIYYTTHRSDEGAGCYRMTINRAARIFEADTDWAENGLAPIGAPGVGIMQMEVWQNNLVAANWSRADVPASSVEFWDKGSGEVVKSLDVAEWFTNFSVDDEGNEVASASGPGNLSVHDDGIYLSGWTSPNIVKIDHDGNTIWVNRNGDLVGDRVTYELAAETGMTVDASYPIRYNSDLSGKAAYFSPRHNALGVNYGATGRDGSGIFNIFADPSIVGPLVISLSTFINIIDRDRSTIGSSSTWDGPNAGQRGPWDGMYWDSSYDVTRHTFERIEGQKFGAAMFFHIPYDLVSGRLDMTAVEAVESAGTPDSYSLGAAYPNPFNPETTIGFNVPTEGFVQIDVFNTVGQTVASLVGEELSAGSYKTTWDGLDQSDAQVSSGVYFYRMQAGDFSATHSMTLLK